MHGRVLTRQPRPLTSSLLTHVRKKKSATSRALSLGRKRSTGACGACARCAALVRVSLCLMNTHCASFTAISLGARLCSDMPAAASIKQLSCACAQQKTPPRALSLGRKRSARARAAPRWLKSILLVPMRPPHQRQASVVRGKAVLLHASLGLAHGRLAHVRKRAATAHAFCGEEAQHACLPRARATPRGLELALRL